ncbi:TPA: ATP-binding protein [Candidatus Woesearchaeota archaeon]|nr:ATP-binding protein [Candidatus Woesearchaeota archaeon]
MPDSEKDQKTVLPVPSSPSWPEEKQQMLKVIEKYAAVCRNLEAQNGKLREMVERMRERAPKLDDLFTHDREGVTFADVGGLGQIVDQLQAFQYGIVYSGVYEQFAVPPPKGLMMHGSPGTGKTMLARAISNELEAMFAEIRTSKFVTKWVGEAESNFENIIVQCENYYREHGIKVVLFLDEAEQLLSKRGDRLHSPVFDRCQDVLLSYMDGINSTQGIIYVAATNRIDTIDSAILRPGRFDFVLEIPKPDKKGVYDIMMKQIAFREKKAKREIYMLDDPEALACRMYSFGATGADIAEVLRLASERKVRQVIEYDGDGVVDPSYVYVDQHDVEAVIKGYAQRVTVDKQRRRIGFAVE